MSTKTDPFHIFFHNGHEGLNTWCLHEGGLKGDSSHSCGVDGSTSAHFQCCKGPGTFGAVQHLLYIILIIAGEVSFCTSFHNQMSIRNMICLECLKSSLLLQKWRKEAGYFLR